LLFSQHPHLADIVRGVWAELPRRFHDIQLDEFVVMPNHIHFIVWLVGAPLAGARTTGRVSEIGRLEAGASPAPTRVGGGSEDVGAPLVGARTTGRVSKTGRLEAGASPAPRSLGDVVGAFKSIAAVQWLKLLKQSQAGISGRVWQRNYYERVIRNERELTRIREYIQNNPLQWQFDFENATREPNSLYERDWAWLESPALQPKTRQ